MAYHWNVLKIKWLKFSLIVLLSIFLVVLWNYPAWGQFVNLDLKNLLKSSSVNARRYGNIEVAEVYLDGHSLFRIAAPVVADDSDQTIAIDWRVTEIQFKLKSLINSKFDPNTLNVRIKKLNSQRVITVNHQYLEKPLNILTVTELDARIDREENTVQAAAKRRADIIESALIQADYERQTTYIHQQLVYSIPIVMGMSVSILIFLAVERIRRAQLLPIIQRSSPESIPLINDLQDGNAAIPRTDADSNHHRYYWLRLPTLRMNHWKWLNRLLWFMTRILLATILIGCTVWILSRFAQTRAFAFWLLRVPVSLLLIPIIVVTAKSILDWLTLLVVSRGVQWFERLHGISHRTQLRSQTILRVSQDITLSVAWIVGILLFFNFINQFVIGIILVAAIAFMAKNTLENFWAGIIILLEDQYATGDIVKIGSSTGVVEFMNLRMTQLRTLDGELVTIKNGSFDEVHNLTSQWSRINLAIDVAYNTDLDKALEIIHQVADDIQHDPEWAPYIIEEPVVLGVDAFGDHSATIRLIIKTQPAKHWDVGREYRRRLKPTFEEAGISIPSPKRFIWVENSSHNYPEHDLNH